MAFTATLLPSTWGTVLKYALWVPADPLLLHRAADGWSAVAGNVQASGQVLGEQHNSMSPASWQAPVRQAYGEKVAAFGTGSQEAADSAGTLSWLLRVIANLMTASLYLSFTIATWLASMALTATLGGPSRLFAELQARSVAAWLDRRLLMLRKLVVDQALQLLLSAGIAWVAGKTLTDGLK
ncbi:hypothetical protein ACTMTI_46895 [Nonomuraea sp. H19]|uniref:hypothetical protein n=1 Tax=Nonomuraea sp. H19 TaxID=3452206 RepID=UPI003F8CE03E